MISIVDDDPSVRRALRRLLRSLGYEVETFNSASDFFASQNQENMECLILDIHMSGMSGFELQQRLIEEGRNLPIIYITAHHDEQTRKRAVQSGAIAYLRKPFDDQSLIEAIRQALSSNRTI